MKKTQLVLIILFSISIIGCSILEHRRAGCNQNKIVVDVIRFVPGNTDANTARDAVISELKTAGVKIVETTPYDYAIEGAVEYSFNVRTREKKVKRLTVLALTKNKTINASTSGGFNPTTDPGTLGQIAGEILVDRLCK